MKVLTDPLILEWCQCGQHEQALVDGVDCLEQI